MQRTLAAALGLLCTSSFAACLSMGESHTGGISTESSVFINRCNVNVAYTYCVDSQGGGPFSCREQKFGSGSVRAGARDGFSIMRANSGPFRVYWSECQATPQNKTPMAVRGRFNGNNVEAVCR
jgi:hypothetical protein